MAAAALCLAPGQARAENWSPVGQEPGVMTVCLDLDSLRTDETGRTHFATRLCRAGSAPAEDLAPQRYSARCEGDMSGLIRISVATGTAWEEAEVGPESFAAQAARRACQLQAPPG